MFGLQRFFPSSWQEVGICSFFSMLLQFGALAIFVTLERLFSQIQTTGSYLALGTMTRVTKMN